MKSKKICQRWQKSTRRVGLRRLRNWADVRYQHSGLDRRRWCRWLNDPEVREHLESVGHWTPRRLRDWVNGSVTTLGTRLFVIVVDGRVVGTLKMDHMAQGGWPSLGLMIGDKAIWGQGVGTAAIEKACWLAKKAGCAGVWAGIRFSNLGSRRSFDKAGFVQVAQKDGRVYWNPDADMTAAIVHYIDQWSAFPARMAVARRLR